MERERQQNESLADGAGYAGKIAEVLIPLILGFVFTAFEDLPQRWPTRSSLPLTLFLWRSLSCAVGETVILLTSPIHCY